MIEPIYDDGKGITIYNADCRDVLPQLEAGSVDLVLTDPPYPGLKGNLRYAFAGVAPSRNDTTTMGTPWETGLDWTLEAWRISRLGMMVFCSYHSIAEVRLALPEAETVGLATWYKRNSPPAMRNVPKYETEFIWLFKKTPGLQWKRLRTLLDVPGLAAGCMAVERWVDRNGATIHPTQKPVELMKRLLAVKPGSVCDPFMGTGTTLVAAKALGISAIGIELSEHFCRVAISRLRQDVMTFETSC